MSCTARNFDLFWRKKVDLIDSYHATTITVNGNYDVDVTWQLEVKDRVFGRRSSDQYSEF